MAFDTHLHRYAMSHCKLKKKKKKKSVKGIEKVVFFLPFSLCCLSGLVVVWFRKLFFRLIYFFLTLKFSFQLEKQT